MHFKTFDENSAQTEILRLRNSLKCQSTNFGRRWYLYFLKSVFIKYFYEGIERPLSKFTDDAELDGRVDQLEGRRAEPGQAGLVTQGQLYEI